VQIRIGLGKKTTIVGRYRLYRKFHNLKNKYAILVPAAERDNIQDTVDSIKYYEPNALVVLIQDYVTQKKISGDCIVLPKLNWPKGSYGGLFQKELYAFNFILKNFDCEIVLRLDADAVFIRPDVFTKVQAIFDQNRNVGMAGAVSTIHGHPRNYDWAEELFRKRGGRQTFFKLRMRQTLAEREKKAFSHGYVRGFNTLGAATFLRTEMLRVWSEFGWLDDELLSGAPIPDDFLLSLHTYAAGYEIADIGGINGLLGVAAVGLPLPPNEIIERKKYIAHSVRSYESLTESEIRNYFRLHRT